MPRSKTDQCPARKRITCHHPEAMTTTSLLVGRTRIRCFLVKSALFTLFASCLGILIFCSFSESVEGASGIIYSPSPSPSHPSGSSTVGSRAHGQHSQDAHGARIAIDRGSIRTTNGLLSEGKKYTHGSFEEDRALYSNQNDDDDDDYVDTYATSPSLRSTAAPRSPQLQARIIGGNAVSERRYPYLVTVFRRLGGNQLQQVCGGTLVAPSVVLSAAHCHIEHLPSVVVIGAHDLSRRLPPDAEMFGIEEARVHLEYNGVGHDFVLFFLDGASKFDTIRLAPSERIPSIEAGDDLDVIGWGQTQFPGGMFSPVPHRATVQYVPNAECDSMYGPSLDVTDDMMCAAGPGRDSCHGDSGGPLIVKGSSSREDVQVGVVSKGIECANERFPGVYARVGSVVDWIYMEAGITIPTEGSRSYVEERACTDVASFDGRRGQIRACAWVGAKEKRCSDYADRCPETCGLCP